MFSHEYFNNPESPGARGGHRDVDTDERPWHQGRTILLHVRNFLAPDEYPRGKELLLREREAAWKAKK